MHLPVFLAGFVLGVIGCVLWSLYVGIDNTNKNARLLRKILAHLDPKDPDGEP